MQADRGGASAAKGSSFDMASFRGAGSIMGTALRLPNTAVNDIPWQEASVDIWEKKYRLVAKDGAVLDKTVDDTWRRIARALSDV